MTRKIVWSDKTIPHFCAGPDGASHRYFKDGKWIYLTARHDVDVLRWGEGWIDRYPVERCTSSGWEKLEVSHG